MIDRIAGNHGLFLRADVEGAPQKKALIDPIQRRNYFGIYQMESGRYVYIRTWDELGPDQLTYFDSAGNAGAHYSTTPGEFFSGPAILNPLPEQLRIKAEERDGEIRLEWQEKGVSSKAHKVAIEEEDVRFQNGDITLAGTLFVPASQGMHPAIVLVHGSGPVTRDFYGPIAYHFVRNGIAVLAYDKRGIGESGGHWLEAGFPDLAKDALAGVSFLKTRKEIDPKKIGLWGISQGGWVAPLAASLSNDVAFLIVVSAAGVTPAEQQIQLVEAESRLQKIPEDKILEQLKGIRLQMDGLRSEETEMELEKEVRQLKEQGKEDLLFNSGLENPLYLLMYRGILDYDPIPVLEKTKCPILVIYGEVDSIVPIKPNRDLLDAALKNAGNSRYEIRIFPRGDHALLESTTGSRYDFANATRFVPGYFDSMVEWINQL